LSDLIFCQIRLIIILNKRATNRAAPSILRSGYDPVLYTMASVFRVR
jgi:hypothetical protein